MASAFGCRSSTAIRDDPRCMEGFDDAPRTAIPFFSPTTILQSCSGGQFEAGDVEVLSRGLPRMPKAGWSDTSVRFATVAAAADATARMRRRGGEYGQIERRTLVKAVDLALVSGDVRWTKNAAAGAARISFATTKTIAEKDASIFEQNLQSNAEEQSRSQRADRDTTEEAERGAALKKEEEGEMDDDEGRGGSGKKKEPREGKESGRKRKSARLRDQRPARERRQTPDGERVRAGTEPRRCLEVSAVTVSSVSFLRVYGAVAEDGKCCARYQGTGGSKYLSQSRVHLSKQAHRVNPSQPQQSLQIDEAAKVDKVSMDGRVGVGPVSVLMPCVGAGRAVAATNKL
ncbi:hypothetical protein BDP81DRAFT_455447 [Colletotrichum phormii]|uniref:Uncharacterized protein n=1 Tax=Colletotrichum phormii TaxID=359342 RepID=A0AAJ0EA19_9PEZI|nr:uncharacterized protein BDP81DRAFT_455447 [Colletotrichum phormii]KAK1622232.1 hypothetical protein BDP81DRAFT_455447 [Colletotrichum phormii]